jgi:hypothetical protein
MKLARALACGLLLAVLAACGTSSPTEPTPVPDAPQHDGGTQHGSGG